MLQADEPDVLPLWFTDAERGWIARTVDPELAELAPLGERALARLAIAPGSADIVLVAPRAPELPLARRYAAVAARPLVIADAATLGAALGGRRPRSVTWFPSLDETDLAGSLVALRGAFAARLGHAPALGALTAETVAQLTWLLVKQLLPRDPREATLTFASTSETSERPSSSLAVLGTDHKVAEVVRRLHGAAGTLLINSHSRPHCGILRVADGPVGLCGLASGGAGGRCIDGSACYFGEAPRVVMQDLRAPRVLFNGCSTANIGGRRADYLPRAAMVSHAALRSQARELVGNVRLVLSDEVDLDWFLAGSALGYPPAQGVELIEAARRASGREVLASALYFGDAANPAWPAEGVSQGEVVIDDDGAAVRWASLDRVLVARVDGRRWAELAAADRLHVSGERPSHVIVAVIPDPWGDRSLVLALPRGEHARGGERAGALTLRLRPLAEPIDRALGETLERAVEHVRWLEALPSFATVLAGASRRLEAELVQLRRIASSRMNLLMLRELLDQVWLDEVRAACRFDDAIIDEALVRSRQSWDVVVEYAHRLHAVPSATASTCDGCGSFATAVDYTDHASVGIERTITGCGHCGVVADMPVCALRVRILSDDLTYAADRVTGRVEITNEDDRPRRVALGVAIAMGGELLPASVARTTVILDGGSASTFAFQLLPAAPLTQFLALRAFLASEGAFGVAATSILFRPNRIA